MVQKASEANVNQRRKMIERGGRLTWPDAAPVRDMRGIEQEHASNRKRIMACESNLGGGRG